MKTGKVTKTALLTAAALALSLLESTIPLGIVIPLPGIKLGLANVAVMYAMYTVGTGYALTVLLCRIFVMYMITGSATALAMSLCGGLLAFAAMNIFRRSKLFSIYGVSIAGAAMHNSGQIICAIFILASGKVIYYLPLLLCASVVSGFLTAAAARGIIRN